MSQLEPTLHVDIPWVKITPSEFKSVNCLVCGENNYRDVKPLTINGYDFRLVQCADDKMFWLNPQPGETFLRSLYSEPYFKVDVDHPGLVSQVGLRDGTEEEHARRTDIAKLRMQEWLSVGMEPYTPSGEKRKFLEVGGGCGYQQKAAQEAGWETIGLDISDYCVLECRKKGLEVRQMDLPRFAQNLPPEIFDLIAMYDVIEHLPNPREYLEVVRRLLKKEGYLTTRLPIFSENEIPQSHIAGNHLWHFNRPSLEKLLEQEGFEVFVAFKSGVTPFGEDKPAQNMTFFTRKI